jgi:FdhE protein
LIIIDISPRVASHYTIGVSMPYVPLEPASRDMRLAAAVTRWNTIVAAQPDLEQAIALQRRLVAVVLEAADTVARHRLPRLSLPAKYLAAKLASGVPALAGEPIPVPATALKPTLIRLCRELSAGGAGEAADRIRHAVEEARIDIGSLLSSSLARDQEAIRAGALHRGLSPDLLWLVAELAISPFAHALQHLLLAPAGAAASATLETDEAPLARALDKWPHGYCPACGSWPALAEIVSGRRMLRCSFCSLAWELPDCRCIYCGSEHGIATLAPEGHRGEGRVEVCAACRGYLKVIDVAAPAPFPLVAIADLETAELDVVAMERGYTRPRLKDLARPHVQRPQMPIASSR